MQILEVLFVLECIHAGPEAVMQVGDQLALLNQPMERLVHQILTLLDVVKDLPPKNKVTAINNAARSSNMSNLLYDSVPTQDDLMEGRCRPDSDKARDLSAPQKKVNQLRQHQVTQAVGIVREKQLFLVDEFPDP
jgi:hypothetical protein